MTDSYFTVDLESKEAVPLTSNSFAELKLLERDHLQQWVMSNPQIIGPDLIVVTSEFADWESKSAKIYERPDILFLDSAGGLIVAELKRDVAEDTVEMQALKYAAYCSNLTQEDIVAMYAAFRKVSEEEARAALLSHAPDFEEGGMPKVKVRIIAGGFSEIVTSVVLFLRDFELDIGCIEVSLHRTGEGSSTAILSSRQLLPLPEAEDFLVSRRRRDAAEEKRTKKKRMPNACRILIEAGAVDPNTTLKLSTEKLGIWKEGVEAWLADNAGADEAEWTNDHSANGEFTILWKFNGERTSPSASVREIANRSGFNVSSVDGTSYWTLPDGRSLSEAARTIWEQSSAGSSD